LAAGGEGKSEHLKKETGDSVLVPAERVTPVPSPLCRMLEASIRRGKHNAEKRGKKKKEK